MSSPVIFVGAYARLVEETERWLANPSGAKAGAKRLVLVPSSEAAARWSESTRWEGEVLAVQDFAKGLLPSGLAAPPRNLSRILEANLPADLRQAIHPQPIPGLHLNAVETILQCRDLGISPEDLGSIQEFWTFLGRFVQSTIPDHIVDGLRVYQYAKRALLTTSLPYHAILVDQAGLMPGASIDFLAALSCRVPMTVTIEPRPGIGYRLACWQQVHPQWVRLAPMLVVNEVMVASVPRQAMAEGALAAMEALNFDGPVDVVNDASGYGEDAFRRLGAGLGPEIAQGRRWQQFYQVSQGQAGRAETIRWLESLGGRLDGDSRRRLWREGRTWRHDLDRIGDQERPLKWARDWGKRANAARSLTELAFLVEEAWDYQFTDPMPWLNEIQSWRALDHDTLQLPPALIRPLLEDLQTTSKPALPERVSGNLHLVASELVAAAPHLLSVHWFGGKSDAIDQEPGAALLPRAARLRWDLERPRERIRRFAFENAASRSHRTLYVVASDEQARFRRLMGPLKFEFFEPITRQFSIPQATSRFAAPEAWYRSHRQSPLWDAWSGQGRTREAEIFASPSRIERYGNCPLAYFYQSILDTGEPDLDEQAIFPTRALIGRWAHATLEMLGDRVALSRLDPRSIRAAVARALDEVLVALSPAATASKVAVEATQDALIGELSQAIYVHRELWQSERHSSREQSMQWGFGGIQWHGRVDRLDEGEGAARLIDYKTGLMKDPNQIQPDNLQLAIYREGVAQRLHVPADQIKAMLIGVSVRNQFRKFLLVRAPDLADVVAGIAVLIQQGRFHPLPLGTDAPCRTCAYRRACPDQIAKEARHKWTHDQTTMRTLWMKDDENDRE